jgi:hypothetical protein
VAAKTFDEWYSEVAKIDGEVSFRMCWKAATDAAEERFTYAQHTQPAKCLGCEYWRGPCGNCCMRGDSEESCIKVGTQQAGA